MLGWFISFWRLIHEKCGVCGGELTEHINGSFWCDPCDLFYGKYK